MAENENNENKVVEQEPAAQNEQKEQNTSKGFMDTPDHTSEFDKEDIEKNKIMAIFAYLSWLIIIPLVAAKDSKFARFHCNQGIVLAIVEIIVWVVCGILSAVVPYVGWIFTIVNSVVSLCCFVLAVIGIINVVNGQAKELPIIGGKFKIIK